MIDWKLFLTRWSRELMMTDLGKRVKPPPESPDWLGFDAASPGDLADLEYRLGVTLPPSYKAFLLVSNGWLRTTTFIGRIRPTHDVDWFRVENEQWVEAYADDAMLMEDDEYYVYRDDGAAQGHRGKDMQYLLQIADVEDGVYLLNPEAVTPDGEWEAWFFANWVPGAERYPSFAHLMLNEYRSFGQSEGVMGFDHDLPELAIPDPGVPRTRARRIGEKAGKGPTLEVLIEQMKTGDEKQRARAVRTFAGKLKGRLRANRRPDLIVPLSDLFNTSQDADVRSNCVQALTELAEDGLAPVPLFEALSDPNPGVVLPGIFALTYFPDPRALDPLCRFINSRVNVLINENAMMHLGEMGDERAVLTLVNVLRDTSNKFDQNITSAAMALARCGQAGFDALVAALDHADPRVRRAVVIGLDCTGDPRATAHLDRMAADPDKRVQERARIRTGNPWK